MLMLNNFSLNSGDICCHFFLLFGQWLLALNVPLHFMHTKALF